MKEFILEIEGGKIFRIEAVGMKSALEASQHAFPNGFKMLYPIEEWVMGEPASGFIYGE